MIQRPGNGALDVHGRTTLGGRLPAGQQWVYQVRMTSAWIGGTGHVLVCALPATASLPILVRSMSFTEVMDHVAEAFEGLGALVLSVGTVWSFLLAGLTWHRSGRSNQVYTLLRQALGGTLLLGLEILVAADLIRTIAVSPTLTNVLILGLIVLIRTFLSFSLETEISGTLPWRRATTSGAGIFTQAAAKVPKSKPPDQVETGRSG